MLMHCEMTYIGNGTCKCVRCPNKAKTDRPERVRAQCLAGDSDDSDQTVFKLGWNYATALARWVAAGQPRRTESEIKSILAICQACPLYRPNKKDTGKGHCKACGCGLNDKNEVTNKIMMATEVCPKGKW